MDGASPLSAEEQFRKDLERVLDAACSCDLGYGVSCGRHQAIANVWNSVAALQAQVDALTRERNALRLPGHKCKPVARLYMGEGRDWWLGELIEPLPDWPEESHCFHVTTPLKSFVLGMNRADWDQLAVLSYIVGGEKHLNASWVERMASGMRKRAASEQGETP